ncbi:MAG: LysR family transcriptional regulator, partial [Ruminococcus sp.]
GMCYIGHGDSMLNEIKIKYFLVLSELLNVSAAAKELHITQQALSKQIGSLEQELDCILFTRVPRGVVLTEAGEVMQKTFYSIQRSMELAMVEIHNNERSNGRVLNIGCASGLRPGPFINPLCAKFQEQEAAQIWFGQPDTYNDLIAWMSEGKFDLVLCTDDFGSDFPELESIVLCQTPFYFFAGKDHPMAAANSSLKDFRDLPFYLTNCDVRTNRIFSICAREHFFPEHVCNTANPYSTYLMAEMGTAVAFGTGFSVMHTNPAVRGYRIPGEDVQLLCLYHPGRAGKLTMRFVEFLKEQCTPKQWYFPSPLG